MDGIYLQYGAPDKVYGKNDKFAEKIAYEATQGEYPAHPLPGAPHGYGIFLSGAEGDVRLSGFAPEFRIPRKDDGRTVLTENGVVAGVRLTGDGREYGNGESALRRACTRPRRSGVAQPHGKGTSSLSIANNEVDIGVRVEVPNAVMDPLTKNLYEAKLVYYSDTFENRSAPSA